MARCSYRRADESTCVLEAQEGSPFCSHHLATRCVSCSEQATHNCDHKGDKGTFCGLPLCESCDHKDGLSNGQVWAHGPVEAEAVKTWWKS